jgi:hypothetical protein
MRSLYQAPDGAKEPTRPGRCKPQETPGKERQETTTKYQGKNGFYRDAGQQWCTFTKKKQVLSKSFFPIPHYFFSSDRK